MANTINHDVRVVNGGTIYMPKFAEGLEEWGNLSFPNVYELGTSAGWPKGTIFRDGFKTFVYTYRHAAYANPGSANYLSPPGAGLESGQIIKSLATAGIAGAEDAYTIQVDFGGACAVNKYAGGEICNLDGTAPTLCQSRYIISNTVQDGDDYVTFTVDGPNLRAVNALDYYTIVEAPYDSCRCSSVLDSAVAPNGIADYSKCIGIVMVQQVLERYTWLQTGGPNASIRVFDSWEGDSPMNFPVYYTIGLSNRCKTQTAGGAKVADRWDPGACQCIGQMMGTSQSTNFETAPVNTAVSQSVWLTILN